MPGEDKQETTTTQQSQTNPWGPTIPLLNTALQKLGGIGTDVTGGQSSALASLRDAVSGLPNFGASASDAVKRLFSSTTAPQVGMLTDSLANLTKNIGGTASGAELDPYSTPGFADAIARATGDITKNVKNVYNASGRDPSGAGSFAGSLGRGLTEGIAPTIASQFNTNKANQMGAAKSLFDAGTGTAGAITGQNQIELENLIKGIASANGVGSLFAAPATAQLGAENASYLQPFQNLQSLIAPLTGIAGLGGQSTGSGTSTTVQPQSLFSNILGGVAGGAGILSSLGGSGGGIGALSSLLALSDERAKDDIEPIGMLHDGQEVVRFRYKGSPKTEIGLVAQDVQRSVPDAVHKFGPLGMLAINPKRATDRAAELAKAA